MARKVNGPQYGKPSLAPVKPVLHNTTNTHGIQLLARIPRHSLCPKNEKWRPHGRHVNGMNR
ncbi:Uncharacterised protein [Chromobacterium violaceum]|uniref:Uncharacterized protein n=1 Tax=Chromobacterium violaceum TaxID=536 RepID=A0A3S4I6Q5_CHRVL|nr:Uncharacterised protein [Chromobacterium violaceum]